MTTKQFEKQLNMMVSNGTLIPKLLDLYEFNKAFMDIMSSVLSDTEADKVFGKFKRKLERAFENIESYSLENCKSIAYEYKSLAPDDSYKAAMDFWFSYFAADFSVTYGDFENEFYDEIVQSAMRALAYSDKDVAFFNDFNDNFEKLLKLTGCFGFGVEADIRPVYERILMKWDEAGELRDR